MDTACLSIKGLIKAMEGIYSMTYYSAFKKEYVLSFLATWISMGHIMLSEMSQAGTERQH